MTERESWEELKRIAKEHPMKGIMTEQHPRPVGYSTVFYGAPQLTKAAFNVLIVDYPSVLR
jgi:hypothetical protein